MTIKRLSRIGDILRQIAETERRICVLREKAESTVQTAGSNPPGVGIADKVGNGAAAIADERQRLRSLKRKRRAEYKRLRAYICGVEDLRVQRIMELKFIDGYTWEQVGSKIGGGNTGDSVRKACVRYMQSRPDKTKKPRA